MSLLMDNKDFMGSINPLVELPVTRPIDGIFMINEDGAYIEYWLIPASTNPQEFMLDNDLWEVGCDTVAYGGEVLMQYIGEMMIVSLPGCQLLARKVEIF